ncbi:MAG: molybdenum cofactor guanylyltransferase [Bacteroidales bacterium]
MDRHLQLVILSGGQNRRFNGQSKAFIKFQGLPLYQRIMKAAGVKKAMVIANSKKDQACFIHDPKITFFTDIIKGKGPLSGVHAALKHAKSDFILLMPSDLPLMNTKTILFLIQHIDPEYDAIIPVSKGIMHPLSAIYAKRINTKLESFLYNTSKTSVKKFLRQISPLYLNMPEEDVYQQAFRNMNTPEDYHSLLKSVDNENQ